MDVCEKTENAMWQPAKLSGKRAVNKADVTPLPGKFKSYIICNAVQFR